MDVILNILNLENNKETPILPTTASCRCCLREKGSKKLASEYIIWNGTKVVFSDLLKETFGLTLTRIRDLSEKICDSCISRLIDANEFKKQVQECDATLRKNLGFTNRSNDERPKLKKAIKKRKIDIDDLVGFDNYENYDDFGLLAKIPKIMPQIEPMVERQLKIINQKLNMIIPFKKFSVPPSKRRKPMKQSAVYSCVKAKKVGDKYIYYRTKSANSQGALNTAIDTTNSNKRTHYISEEVLLKAAFSKPRNKSFKNEDIESKVNEAKKLKWITRNEYGEIHENGKKILLHTTAYPFRLKYPYTSLQCVYCLEQGIEFTDLRAHMEENHTQFDPAWAFYDKKKSYIQAKVECSDLKCRICSEPFDSLEVIARHLKQDHDISIDLELEFGLIPYKFEKNKVLTCAICHEKLKNFGRLNRHMTSHYLTFMCDQCGKSYSSRGALKTHLMYSHGEKPLCWHCKTPFETRAEMNAHYKNTYACWNYACKLCGEKFARGTQKQVHMTTVHGLDSGLHCTACGEKFAKRGHLDMHFLRYHSETSPRCKVCDKVFVSTKLLADHMSSHTGATPYECQQCGKQYATRKALVQHMRINHKHHFSCEECNKHFGCKSSLLNHNATHH